MVLKDFSIVGQGRMVRGSVLHSESKASSVWEEDLRLHPTKLSFSKRWELDSKLLEGPFLSLDTQCMISVPLWQ